MSNLAVSGAPSRPAFRRADFRNGDHHHQRISHDHRNSHRFARVDELTLGDAASVTRINTQVRSKTQLRVSEDGSTQLKSRTQLRYNYEFESADGTKVSIKARANLKFSAQQDDEGNLRIRAKAKIQVSLLQESVNSEAAPFIGDGNSDDLIAGLSQALSGFNEVVDQATASFLNGDGLNGDGLIVDLVNAFNGLSEALEQPVGIEQTEDESPVAETDPVIEVAPAEDNPVPVLADEPTATESNDSPATGDSIPVAIAEPEVVSPVTIPTETVPSSLPVLTEPVVIPEIVDDIAQPTTTNESAATTEPVTSQSLRLRLRVRFTESLSQLVRVFNNDGETQTQTRTVHRQNFAANLKFSGSWNVPNSGDPEQTALDLSV